MAKQASKTVIGGFVVSAIVLLIVGVIIFGGGKFFKKTIKVVLFFERSVSGLSVGAPVVFRGVEVGAVADVVILADTAKMEVDIPVIVEVEPDRFQIVGERLPPDPYDKVRILAERGLRCQLATESLVTGQLMVEMGFFPDSPGHLKGIDVGYPELPTQASDFEQLAEKMKKLPIEEIFGKVLKAVARIESFLSNPELADIVHNLKTASEKLDTVMSGVDGVVEGADVFVRRLDRQVEPLSGGAQAAIRDARNLMNHLDREVGQLAPKLQETLASAKNTLDQAGQTLATYEDLVDDKSALRNNLNTTLIEISAAAQSLQTFLDYLEQHPEALLQGKGSGGGQ